MAGTDVEGCERERGDHENDRGPGGKAGKDIGRGAGTERGLRALSAEGTGKVGRASLLNEDDSDEKQADDDVHGNDEIEENLHC